VRRLAAPDIAARKGGDPIVCLTAYTAPVAAILDDVCDLLLVGDSLGMVVHGLPNTVGVTLEMMILHGQAVMRGSRKAMVVVDMPFGSYEGDPSVAYDNAARIMKETGCQAVKVESGSTVPATIDYLVKRGIPVMGHVGLRPQAVHQLGGYRMQRDCDMLLVDARAAADAGAFAVVLECVPQQAAAAVTAALDVPTIGIGAGPDCDGQVLVMHDLVGLSFDRVPKFVRAYADARASLTDAIGRWRADVERRTFPGPAETLG
jgi:3-methyl-2-oxobutanoate hydroxymethyltransferase